VNIYLLSQDDRRGYDTYDSCVVYAESEDEARQIHPSNYRGFESSTWASCPENVDVSYMGSNPQVTEPGLILSSFKAG
jgi:hypothetical protein